MRTPLMTREGVADWPIEPGARTLCEPCETGPRENPWRLIVPAKPLPFERPLTLIASPGSKPSTVTTSPAVSSNAPRNSCRWRCGAMSFLARCPRSGFESLRSGTSSIGELHRVVAVVGHGLDLRDRARTSLDHGDGDACRRPP